jgi:putative ABC transport system substrate-binding protein
MKHNARYGLVIGLVVLLIGAIYLSYNWRTPGSEPGQQQRTYRVGIFQIVRHPVLDTAPEGFREALAARISEPIEYKTMVPEGDPGKIEQMATIFATENYDLVFVVGTNCAQSLAKKTSTLPIVLGAATDPQAAGLVDSWEKPGGNITGTSDLSPVGAQLDRLRELLPQATRIGVIYNPSEDNSQAIIARFEAECLKRGLTPVPATIASQNEMKQTVVSLVGKIDALYAPTDATVQTAFDVLIKTANEINLPVFNCDEGTARKGALFSVGFNYKDIGYTSGEMAAEILQGKARPADMPIRLVEKTTLYFNPEQIRVFGLETPAEWQKLGTAVSE